jgi:hypothetical protein
MSNQHSCTCDWKPSFWILEWTSYVAGQPFPEFQVDGQIIDAMFHDFLVKLARVAIRQGLA